MSITRRQFVASGLITMSASSVSGHSSRKVVGEILDTSIISQSPQNYHGWPTVARQRDGTLLLVCSGGREAHVCPFGRVELLVSKNGGKSWAQPRVLADGLIDDRDAGVLETDQGTLLVNWFTSLAFESTLAQAEQKRSFAAERLKRWQEARDRLSPEQRKTRLGE